jgi:hypothetical protein
MVPKCKLLDNIPLHGQRLNCGTCVCELEDHVREKRIEFKLANNVWAHQKTSSCKFS